MPEVSNQPNEVGGYTIVRTLAPGLTWLATAPGHRQVVLKTLDDDCLWKGQLHPNIKDRLGRVRELAHPGVANLYGVERDGALVYAVWDYVPGQTLADFANSTAGDERTLITLARELMLALEMLHARGIVHGAIKASNIIVHQNSQTLTLTHVSPLLYNDPQEDVRAAIQMLHTLATHKQPESPLARFLDDPSLSERSPRQLAVMLGALTDTKEPPIDPIHEADRKESTRIRRRAILGAAATATVAIALFAGLKIYASRTTPATPTPPEASPAALQPAPHTDSKKP